MFGIIISRSVFILRHSGRGFCYFCTLDKSSAHTYLSPVRAVNTPCMDLNTVRRGPLAASRHGCHDAKMINDSSEALKTFLSAQITPGMSALSARTHTQKNTLMQQCIHAFFFPPSASLRPPDDFSYFISSRHHRLYFHINMQRKPTSCAARRSQKSSCSLGYMHMYKVYTHPTGRAFSQTLTQTCAQESRLLNHQGCRVTILFVVD